MAKGGKKAEKTKDDVQVENAVQQELGPEEVTPAPKKQEDPQPPPTRVARVTTSDKFRDAVKKIHAFRPSKELRASVDEKAPKKAPKKDEDGEDFPSDEFSDAGSDIEATLSRQPAQMAYQKACDGARPSSRIVHALGTNTIDMRTVQLGDRDVVPLAAAISTHGTLLSLRLVRTGLTREGVEALIGGIQLRRSTLTDVDISENPQVGDRAMGDLAMALGEMCPDLKRLACGNCNVSDGGALKIGSAFRRHAKLEDVDVSGNKIGQRGSEGILRLVYGAGSSESDGRGRRDGGLLKLRCSWNLLTTEAGLFLANALQSGTTALVTLDLSYNALEDDAGYEIARGIAPTVTTVDLARNRLGERTAFAFADVLRNFGALAVLKLGWNPLGVAGGVALIEAVKFGPFSGRRMAPPALRALHIENTADDDVSLVEAAANCLAHFVYLDMAAPSIVVEFPPRIRLTVPETTLHQELLYFGLNPREDEDVPALLERHAARRQQLMLPAVPAAQEDDSDEEEEVETASSPPAEAKPPHVDLSPRRARMTEKRPKPVLDFPPPEAIDPVPRNSGNLRREASNASAPRTSRSSTRSLRRDDSMSSTTSTTRFQQNRTSSMLLGGGSSTASNGASSLSSQRGLPVDDDDDVYRVLGSLVTWNRRKDESSYFNNDNLDRCFYSDWDNVIARTAVQDELIDKNIVASRREVGETHRKPMLAKQGSVLPRAGATETPLAQLEACLLKHYGFLLSVFRYYASVASKERATPTRVSRHGFDALLDRLRLVDRRRLCSNTAAIDKAFYFCVSRGEKRSQSRGSRDAVDDEPGLTRSDLIAALLLYVGGLLVVRPPDLDESEKKKDEASVAEKQKKPSPKKSLGLAAAFDKLMTHAAMDLEASYPLVALKTDCFRKYALYTTTVDNVLRVHARPLGELYTYYSENILMSVSGWLQMLHDAKMIFGDHRDDDAVFEGDLTAAEARCCFTFAQIVKQTDERREIVNETLTRIDFVEAICWLAIMKPLPSREAIHAPWSRRARLSFFDLVDDPVILDNPDMAIYVDKPKLPPRSEVDARRLDLPVRVLKLLIVFYLRLSNAHDQFAPTCRDFGIHQALQQLAHLEPPPGL